MGCTQVEEAKPADLCRRHGVRELSLFGSAARNEMRPESGIGLLVEFLPEAQVDLFPLINTAVLEEARLLYAA